MFLWKNAIVVTALLLIVSAVVHALGRSNQERVFTLKLMLAGVIAVCLTLSFVPEPACQLAFGGLFLLCVDRRVPMIATYLFFLIWMPSVAGYLVIAGTYLVPLKPVITFSLALLAAYVMHPHMKLRRPINSADLYLLAFLLIFCVCLSLRAPVTDVLRNFVSYALPYGLTYYVLSRTRIEKPELVLRMFAYAAAASGALCFFESVRYWPVYSGLAPLKGVWNMVDIPDIMLIRGGFFRACGPFAHPLTASAVLGMAGVALFGLFRIRRVTPPMLALAAATFLGLFATVSRTGIVTLAVGLMTVQLLRKRYAAVLAMMVLGLIAIFGVAFLSGQDAQSNATYRLALLTGVPKALGSKLLFGYREAVQLHILDAFVQGQGIVDLVNVYLSIAVQGGVVSLIPYIVFLGTSFTQYRALRRSGPGPEQLILAQSCIGMQAGFAASAFFMGAWGSAMQISFLCIAIIVVLRQEVKIAGKGGVVPAAAAPTIADTDFCRLPALD
jgi:hypothetical protein